MTATAPKLFILGLRTRAQLVHLTPNVCIGTNPSDATRGRACAVDDYEARPDIEKTHAPLYIRACFDGEKRCRLKFHCGHQRPVLLYRSLRFSLKRIFRSHALIDIAFCAITYFDTSLSLSMRGFPHWQFHYAKLVEWHKTIVINWPLNSLKIFSSF